ncbi:PD-(D/E)XK nuclease family protein [Candidatus Omnitrophota bacterium]
MERCQTISFCDDYIERVAEFIDQNYIKQNKDISRLALVFGGKRPALFLKRALATRLKSNFFPPKIFTIDEFMAGIVREKQTFTRMMDLEDSYVLYKLVEKTVSKILRARRSFAQFLPWSREILAFIDQLDLENVDDRHLENIKANAQIGYAVPKDINRLLRELIVLRGHFHAHMNATSTFTRGYIYLKAKEVIDEVAFDQFDSILFCNFFYFNRCEEAVVQSLYARRKGVFLFQGDARKWPILDRLSKKMSLPIKEGEVPQKPQFDLKLYAGFDLHSQVCLVRNVLSTIKNKAKTVIVLPDAEHIVPLLSEIGSELEEHNISMGYPLKRSSLVSLFELIFKAQSSRKTARYYAKDYLKVLRHPFIKNCAFSADVTVTRVLVGKIEEMFVGGDVADFQGRSFVDFADIEGCTGLMERVCATLKTMGITCLHGELEAALLSLHQLLFVNFEKIKTLAGLTQHVRVLLDVLLEKSNMQKYPLNCNIVDKVALILDEFENLVFKDEGLSAKEVFQLFQEKLEREIVAFIGTPLKGLQILGLFETRSLNFENVIICDVNEGSLPRLSIYEPLIPREVMIGLNLDRLEMEEEIQRYQFMRLISSAKHVHLIYQESRDKEKSRFIEELIWERQKETGSLETISVERAQFQVAGGIKKDEVAKTPEMIAFLKSRSYSASSLNMYLRCPMEFYMNYCLGLREVEDVFDEPDARHIGTFVHELLENAFKLFLNKKPQLNATFKKNFFEQFNDRFEQVFGVNMRSDAFLLKTVLLERLTRFIENEEENPDRAVQEILYLEKPFEESIQLESGLYQFKYIVDRVDRLRDGSIMLLDYKTGAVDVMPKEAGALSSLSLSRESIRDQIRSFQMPLYFHYLSHAFEGERVNAALYNLRTCAISPFIGAGNRLDAELINQVYLRALNFVLAEITNIDVPFKADEG